VDDLDAGFHYNIACSYQVMGDHIGTAEHFRTAIMLGMGKKRPRRIPFGKSCAPPMYRSYCI
jgi:hypothetical protein